MREIQKGATDVTVYVEILDSTSTSGARKTGLVFNSAGLTCYYARNRGSATQLTLATLAAANSAHSDGGFKEVDATNMPGVYRLDLSDAVVASGADDVTITLRGATGAAQVSLTLALVAFNPQDATRMGLTALPNANAEAAGGLYTRGSGAGQINQNANGQVDTRTVAMANDVVTAAAIADNAIDAGSIAASAITAAKFAAGAIDANAIAANAIGSSEIADGAITSAKLATGAIVAATFAAGAIDANAIAADAIGSSELAASAVNEIADQVWDEAISGHLGAGSTGAALNAAGSAGDPWTTPLPGAYGAGTAGKIIGDNINATISSRSTLAAGAAMTLTTGERDSVADAMLDRNMATGTDSGSATVRTVRQALRFLRNKWDIVGGVLTVKKEDDTTTSWTGAVTTDVAAEPVVGSDPASS